MNDIADLYQELIIDHSSRPRNFKALDAAHCAEGFNPLCGDRLTVYLRMDGDVIADASFQGEGCAISKASASLMTESHQAKDAELRWRKYFRNSVISLLVSVIPISKVSGSWPHFQVCMNFPCE